jgi:ribosomal protein L7/L12
VRKVTLSYAYERDLQKVGLTKLLRSSTGLSLAPAKKSTGRIVRGEAIIIEVASWAEAERLAEQARGLGATAIIEPEGA